MERRVVEEARALRDVRDVAIVRVSDTRINDGTSDSFPSWVSSDGCTFFFVSHRAGGVMRAYRVVVSLSP